MALDLNEEISAFKPTNNKNQVILQGKRLFVYDYGKGTIVKVLCERNDFFVVDCIHDDQNMFIGLINKVVEDVDSGFPMIEGEEYNVYRFNDDAMLYAFHSSYAKIFSTLKGGLLVKTVADGQIMISDLSTAEELLAIEISGQIKDCFFNESGTKIMVLCENGDLTRWSLKTGLLEKRLNVGNCESASMNSEGNIMVFVREEDVYVYNLERGITTKLPGNFKKAEVSYRGNTVIALDAFGAINVFDCQNL